jgi:hypothetical protein
LLPSSAHLARRAQHLVGARDDARVHLIGALGRDEVGDLGDRVDVGLFEIGLQQVAGAVDVGQADLRLAAGGGLGKEVVADGREACLVDETRELELAELGGGCIRAEIRFDLAIR